MKPKDLGLSSSEETETDVEEAEASAASEDEKSEEKERNLLDVVKDVVAKPDEQATEGKEEASTSESEAEDGGSEDKAEEGASEKDAAAPSDEEQEQEDAQLPFNKHPRWQKVYAERKQFKENAEKLTAELDEMRPAAEQFGVIQNFMSETGLTPTDVSQGFEIMALFKGDPPKAREVLMSLVGQLDDVTGNTIPDDLQKRMDDGEIDEASAKELSKSRAEKRAAEDAAKRSEDGRKATEKATLQNEIVNGLNTHEEAIAAADPDYATLKKPLVDKSVVAHVAKNGMPPTVEEARKVFDDALKEAETIVGKIRPSSKKPTRVVRSTTTGSGNGAAAPDPKTLTLAQVVATAAAQGREAG